MSLGKGIAIAGIWLGSGIIAIGAADFARIGVCLGALLATLIVILD